MRNCIVFHGLQLAFLAATMLISGCDDDKRVAQIAEEAANRPAEQNKAMSRQSEQTAEATKTLVAADAKARQELTALQHHLRADQAVIGQKRDALESERQQIATERKWDRLLAPALTDFGIFLVITACLGFCWYLLVGIQREKMSEPAVEEILIQELVSENPRLLPPAPSAPPVLDYHLPAESDEASSVSHEPRT